MIDGGFPNIPGLADPQPREFTVDMSTLDMLQSGNIALDAPAIDGVLQINITEKTDLVPLVVSVEPDAIRLRREDGSDLDIAYDRAETELLRRSRRTAILTRPISELVFLRTGREGVYLVEEGESVVGDMDGVDDFMFKISYFGCKMQKRQAERDIA